MRVVGKATSPTNASLTLGVAFNGSDAGFPFRIDVNVTYTLSSGAGLAVAVRATNTADDGSPAPFMAGCHPYFKLLNSDFGTAKLELDRSCTGWNRQGQSALQCPDGRVQRFDAFNGTDTLADPHTPCGAACGSATSGVHWDDGFTPTAAVAADCANALTMTVHDRAANSRGPGGPTGPLSTPSMTPWILSRWGKCHSKRCCASARTFGSTVRPIVAH